MTEHLFICGPCAELVRSAIAKHELRLTGPQANIRLRLDDIRRKFSANEPELLTDFLEIATYVFAVDNVVSRGGPALQNMAAKWRRSLRLVMAVRRPDRWSEPDLSHALQRTLNFLTDDNWRLEFVRMTDPPELQGYLKFSDPADDAARGGNIVLFSGGLDSLAGAVSELHAGNERVILVSHRSSNIAASRQAELVHQLKASFSDRIMHVPVDVGMTASLPPIEHSQRTRSFLFTAIATVVSALEDSERIHFFENGVMSLNLPIATQIVGTRATRTTHPHSLLLLQNLVRLIRRSNITVDNPFFWMTKAEVIQTLSYASEKRLIRRTISCSRTREITAMHPHCGSCAQCLQRRFGVLGAEADDFDPAEGYALDLLLSTREDGEPRVMAVDMVRSALEYLRLSDDGLVSRFVSELARLSSSFPGIPPQDLVSRFCDLLRRHGATVRDVLVAGVKKHADALIEKKLDASCLLRIALNDPDLEFDRSPITPTGQETINAPRANDNVSYSRICEIFIAIDTAEKHILISGIPKITGSTSYRLMSHLIDNYKIDRDCGKRSENFRSIPSEKLIQLLSLASPEAVRSAVYRFRKFVSEEFEKYNGVTLRRDAVIENCDGRGYRLNPAVRLVAPAEIELP